MNEEIDNNKEIQSTICLPCETVSDVRTTTTPQYSRIVLEDGKKEEDIEIAEDRDSNITPTAVVDAAASPSILQPATARDNGLDIEGSVKISGGKMRMQELESSDDESLEENFEEMDFVSEIENYAPVVRYEKEDISLTGIKDLCLHLQLCSLCTENEVQYARDNFDKIDEVI